MPPGDEETAAVPSLDALDVAQHGTARFVGAIACGVPALLRVRENRSATTAGTPRSQSSRGSTVIEHMACEVQVLSSHSASGSGLMARLGVPHIIRGLTIGPAVQKQPDSGGVCSSNGPCECSAATLRVNAPEEV